jgi:hypothetical protein
MSKPGPLVTNGELSRAKSNRYDVRAVGAVPASFMQSKGDPSGTLLVTYGLT